MKKFYVWIIILLLFDLGTKVWVGRSISIGESIQVNDILNFVLVHNKGMGFGMFSSYPHLVLLLQFIGVIAITWFLTTISSKHTILQSVTKILIISGAIGNLLNRFILGYVIDFISIKPYPFVFNLADLELRTGLILFIYLLIKESLHNFKAEKIDQRRF